MKFVFKDTAECRGEFHIEVLRKGQIVDEHHDHNMVVNVGRERLANLAAGLSDKYITQIGVGTGKPSRKKPTPNLKTSTFSRW